MNASKVATYAGTVLVFPGSPERSVDLRRTVSRVEREILTRMGLAGPFAVLTAQNPDGKPAANQAEARQNGIRQERLEAMLAGMLGAAAVVRVDGCSPDRTHCERSVAAPLSEPDAHRLAVRFRQDAFFWYDAERFWLVGAREPLGRIALPLDPEGSPQG